MIVVDTPYDPKTNTKALLSAIEMVDSIDAIVESLQAVLREDREKLKEEKFNLRTKLKQDKVLLLNLIKNYFI